MQPLFSSALLLALGSFLPLVSAQTAAPVPYEDPDTGIIFDTWNSTGIVFGFALPSDALETDATEFIGLLRCASESKATGWCGLSLGGTMTNNLLVAAYPNEDQILTALMWATGYEMPVPYTGDAEITQVSSKIEEGSYELIYRCVGCLAWDQGGSTGGPSTSSGRWLLGWALATTSPTNPSCPADITLQQHETQNIFSGTLTEDIANESYDDWAALATGVVAGDCDGSGEPPSTTTSALPTGTGTPVPTGVSYDYIVIGGGAGGIPIADKLSEDGNSVLLIEKGPPSTGQWGGTRKPEWLESTDLTRFDVPGLCNEIWVDSAGIACRDTDQMAGCILGGGTAINAGLWWNPKAEDWDYNFPEGWKSENMKGPAGRVFDRIPGTLTPSQDGKLYLPQAWEVLSGALGEAGWSEVNGITEPDKKNRSYTHGPFMFAGGERGGPLATYLATAAARSNFEMWTNTQAKRVIREGGHITGVEVENYAGDGYVGVVNVTASSGRVILSAGTFGSAKLLMRSGIGPQDQLEVVAGSSIDGSTMIDEAEWIELPVGYNLEDHTNTDTVISHPDVVFYDFYEAYDDPITEDKNKYLDDRAGILAQAAPNIGPLFFDEIEGDDGVTRSLQWTARVEASLGVNSTKAITMSQYLGRGAKSRGRMTITSALSTVVSTVPYLRDDNDIDAVVLGIENLQEALSGYDGITWHQPAPGQSAREYVEDMIVSTSNRRANHWIGTNKIGKDDGRQNGGTAVVDLDTRVYGTDNLFVVDASIFPGHITTNPSAYIVTASERASERIIALAPAKAGAKYDQCAGSTWTGSFHCAKGLTCTKTDSYYSQCQ